MNPQKKIKYSSITKTFQNGYNSCFLACVESFYSDLGKDKSQHEMLTQLKSKNLCDEKGLIFNGKLIVAGKELGLFIEEVDDHFPIYEKYEDNSLFISVDYSPVLPQKEGNLHIVRYNHHLNDKEIIIMDPRGFMGLRIWNKEDLDIVRKEFFHVKIDEKL